MLFTPPSTKLLHRLRRLLSSPPIKPYQAVAPSSRRAVKPNHLSAPYTLHPTSYTPARLANFASLGFILLFSLTPLIFTPLTSELFEFPKMVFVYAITIYELSLYLWQCWRRKTIIVPQTPLTKPILIYLGGLLLATIFSMNLYTSIAGYYTRFNGGLTSTLAYIVLFYLFLIHLTSDGRRETGDGSSQTDTDQLAPVSSCRRAVVQSLTPYLWAWLLSAALVSIYGIFEHFGHDPSCLVLRGTFTANCWVEDVSARVFATFGQPNWLATYLIATLPIGLALLTSTTNRLLKILTWISTLLCYAAFWYTYSRSAWFGLVAALGVFAVILLFKKLDGRRETGDGSIAYFIRAVMPSCRRAVKSSQLLWLLPLLLACTLVSLSSFHMAASRATSTLESGADDSSTGQIRLLVWQGSINLIKDHPLIGTGPETFAYSFLPYRPRAMNDTTEWNFLYNKAHNEVLNRLATTGLLGTLPWLALYVYALLLALNLTPTRLMGYVHVKISTTARRHDGTNIADNRAVTRHPSPVIPAALAAGIVGVFVSQLFGFSVVVTDLLFWLALALLATPTSQITIIPLTTLKKFQIPNSRFQIHLRPSIFPLLSSFLIIPAAYTLFAYTSAEILASRASANLTNGNLTGAISQGQQAIAFNPFEPTYHKDLAYTYAYIASLNQTDAYSTNLAVTQAKIAYRLNPYDQLITKGLISVYQTLAYTDPSYNQQAIAMAQHSLNLAPTDAASAQTLAELQLSQNQKDAAYRTLQTLITLRPHAGDSYYRLALYYAKYGPAEKEKQTLQQALKIDPNLQQAKDLLNNINRLKTLPGDD